MPKSKLAPLFLFSSNQTTIDAPTSVHSNRNLKDALQNRILMNATTDKKNRWYISNMKLKQYFYELIENNEAEAVSQFFFWETLILRTNKFKLLHFRTR